MDVYLVHAKDRVSLLERSLSFENVSFLLINYVQQYSVALTG